MARIFLLSSVLALSACASLSAHQKAFAVGAIAKESVEQAHRVWDEYVEAKIVKCAPATNAEIVTKSDYRACLGPATSNNKVIVALEALDLALGALGIALKNTDPTVVKTARSRVLQASQDAFELMGPDATRFAADLQKLVETHK